MTTAIIITRDAVTPMSKMSSSLNIKLQNGTLLNYCLKRCYRTEIFTMIPTAFATLGLQVHQASGGHQPRACGGLRAAPREW